jgi:hypothetical protein
LNPLTVKPGRGILSVTVVVGWHATFPTLVTVTSNTNGKPGIGGSRSGTFVIARSHPGLAVGDGVGVMVGVAVGVRSAVPVGVGVALHLPLFATAIDRMSESASGTLKISISLSLNSVDVPYKRLAPSQTGSVLLPAGTGVKSL